jgi:hypothetical protein
MKVAWQFTAWNAFSKSSVSAAADMSWSTSVFTTRAHRTLLPTQSYRFLTGQLFARVHHMQSPEPRAANVGSSLSPRYENTTSHSGHSR